MKKILFLLLLAESSLQSMSENQQEKPFWRRLAFENPQENFFWAAGGSNASYFKESLTEVPIDVNAVDTNGKTALAIVISSFNLDWSDKKWRIKELIERGADVNLKMNISKSSFFYRKIGNQDITALMIAVSEPFNIDLVKILIENGADINAQNAKGWSPLMIAVLSKNSLKLIKLLIENGADIDQKNSEGQTAIDIAEFRKKWDVANYLKDVKKKNVMKRLEVIKPLISQNIPITQVRGPGDIILDYLGEEFVPEIKKKFEQEEKVGAEKCVIS